MIGNMLNDLAKAIRRWTEKKYGQKKNMDRYASGNKDPSEQNK